MSTPNKHPLLVCLGLLCIGAVATAEDTGQRTRTLDVQGASDDYTETDATVKKGDLIFVTATGTVVTGAWNGATGSPWGHAGQCGAGSETDGALMMKIGNGTPVRVGGEYSVEADHDGAVKFKVRDTKYSDNSGKYQVNLALIPAQLLGEATTVTIEAANDEWTPAEMDVSTGDLLVVRAAGEATVQGAKRSPSGLRCNGGSAVNLDNDGALAAKVGTTAVFRLSEISRVALEGGGPLKFRVRSGSKYESNSGKYSVRVNVVKAQHTAKEPAGSRSVATKGVKALPGGFASVDPSDLMKVLYPGFDSSTQAIDGGKPRHAELIEAKRWLNRQQERLAVLVSRWEGTDGEDERQATASNGTVFCDVAVAEMKAGKPSIVAKASAVTECGGASSSSLDLAPYRFTADDVLLGVRRVSMNHGYGDTTLRLLQVRAGSLENVFDAVLESSSPDEPDDGSTTVVDVVPHGGGPNDMQLTTKSTDGKITGTKVFRWDGKHYAALK